MPFNNIYKAEFSKSEVIMHIAIVQMLCSGWYYNLFIIRLIYNTKCIKTSQTNKSASLYIH